ncbi:hypothetical protein GJ744_008628 [Endocarpon pusillum]|uniref:Uncharacterized protein n=1 Tax=Endocarpon pusillum TaxID=364733 RepID=A0A8H7AIT0_9EURO|nr:hypothetical protein GJ744_008628 [Endocarpon pusillum]
MAPLRSSRSNRHLQQETGPPGRIRGGVVDHDPMEGLPVRRWEKMEVTIKQDVRDDDKNDDGKDGTNPDWPWPDLPLPKDFHLLPPHSQELLRRARAPNKNPNIAVFNRETGEYERFNLNPSNPATMTPATTTQPASGAAKDGDHDIAEPEDTLDADKPLHDESKERSFTVRKWVPLPQHIADKKPEPKYLADRRPGLPPLYGHQSSTNPSSSAFTGYAPNISSTLQNPSNINNNTNTGGDVVVGTVTVPTNHTPTASGYRVSADGTTMPMGPGIASTQAQGEAPRRRPPPPPPKRRKKGGPGRSRKRVDLKNPVIGRADAGAGLAGNTTASAAGVAGGGVEAAVAVQPGTTNTGEARVEGQQQGAAVDSKAGAMDTQMGEAEEEGGSSSSSSSSSDNSSEDEGGSEEGEIDEGGAGDAAGGATEGAPEVSVQPPSPDLLGNLESEIRGMEEGGPAV